MDAKTRKQALAVVATLNNQEKAKVEVAMNILTSAGIRLADRLADEAVGRAKAPSESVCTMSLASFFESLSFAAMRDEADAQPART